MAATISQLLRSADDGTDEHPQSLDDVVARTGVPDLFVLRRVEHDRFMHIGGAGRGTGWAGIVHLHLSDEPHAAAAITRDEPVRVTSGLPTHVFGPYHARDAILIPVSHDVLVVVGSPTGTIADDGLVQALRCAPAVEALVGEISPAKRLADELEVLHAVKATMQVPAAGLTDVMRHVASTTADALSCEVAVVYLTSGEQLVVHDRRTGAGPDAAAVLPIMRDLAEGTAALPTCTQRAAASPLPSPLSPGDGVASYYVLRLGDPDDLRGLLLVCHMQEAARGFTTLCQELGVRVAEAADTVLHSAQLREDLERQVAAVERDAMEDPLTGLPNRRAFDAAVTHAELSRVQGRQAGVIVVDLNGLKAANDVRGHDVGDQMIRSTAEVLLATVGSDGLIARLGGDEFVVLVHEVTATEPLARRICDAIDAAADVDGMELSAAVGHGVSGDDDDVREALRRADKAMYAAKLRSGRGRLGAAGCTCR